MIETTESPEEIEKLLVEARAKLQGFEDGVDRTRLLQRVRAQSPAHPVLLLRTLFIILAILLFLSGLVVMLVPLLDDQLARSLAQFDAVVPAPPGVPGLPALLGLLMVCMLVGWTMTTLAAYAIGRDTQMLPWEQKQHQRLVNEVTRLTTQKAVMERIRGTPAGARPRIATPVPISLRDRPGMATPPGVSRASVLGGRGAPASYGSAGFPERPNSQPGGGMRPGPPDLIGARSTPDSGGLFGTLGGGAPTRLGGGEASVLSRARGGSGARVGGGALPEGPTGLGRSSTERGEDTYTSGGRWPPGSPASPERGIPSPSVPSRPGGLMGGATDAPLGRPRLAAPVGFPGTPVPAERDASLGRDIFGTPPQASAPRSEMSYQAPEGFSGPRRGSGLSSKAGGDRSAFGERVADRVPPSNLAEVREIVHAGPGHPTPAPPAPRVPRWGRIDEPWLEEALQRAEDVAATFPEQAHLEFSQEDHLPFTLVIARATPAMAARAMVAYVEFLASIVTPPRGRIELNHVPHLDRSFHRNVAAALEPYFGDKFEVEPEIGRVEITFSEPDPAWQDYPVLPTA